MLFVDPMLTLRSGGCISIRYFLLYLTTQQSFISTYKLKSQCTEFNVKNLAGENHKKLSL
jgi:hypothetical protein